MDPREKLKQYIEDAGGFAVAAAALGCSESTLRSVGNGWRGVSSRMAARWEEASDGELPFDEMARIVAIKEPPAKAAKRKPRARGRK